MMKLQEIETLERARALALLKLVELARRQVKEGKFKEAEVAFDELDLKINRFKKNRGRAFNSR